MLPVLRALREDEELDAHFVHTGQHREMVEQVLGPFGIQPDADLAIMKPGQSLNDIVAHAMPRLDRTLRDKSATFVLVQGDTTSAFCAGLAAFQLGVGVGHVEAGLRSYDRFHPFPEESNRKMISAFADLHFAPTDVSRENLLKEGVRPEDVLVTGNTAIDALVYALETLGEDDDRPLGSYRPDRGRPLVLVTLHRRENWRAGAGEARSPLAAILEALGDAARSHPECDFVYPVHRNPNVRALVDGIRERTPNFHLIDPLPYLDFVRAMGRSHVIVSDSGGVQEEAPSLGVPVLVTREVTERPEGLAAGSNRLVGSDPDLLRREIEHELSSPRAEAGVLPRPSVFGDGQAARRIVGAIRHRLLGAPRPDEFVVPGGGRPPTARGKGAGSAMVG